MSDLPMWIMVTVLIVLYISVCVRAWSLRHRPVVIINWYWLGASAASAALNVPAAFYLRETSLPYLMVSYILAYSLFMLAHTARSADVVVEKKV